MAKVWALLEHHYHVEEESATRIVTFWQKMTDLKVTEVEDILTFL